jgi:DNA invertase Pin-like site-specific DNA recombinase
MRYIRFLTNYYRFINTTCSTFVSISWATFNIFSAPLEFERELIRERTNAGLKAWGARGIRARAFQNN